MKKFFLIILLFLCFDIYSQQTLNVLLTINNKTVTSTDIVDASLIIDKDTIGLNYEMGRFELSLEDYKIVKSVANKKDVCLVIEYSDFLDNYVKKEFKICFNVELLLQRYFFLKVYDFTQFPKHFVKKNGYGFEYLSPIETKELIKKKTMTQKYW